MLVFKFGGASISSVERIRNIGNILQQYSGENILVVISAMGKTTNALEKVVDAFCAGNKEEALQLFDQIRQQHLSTAQQLLETQAAACENQLRDFFTEAEWLLHDRPVREHDYYYDQIVCCGELISSAIVSHYLNAAGCRNQWFDVRDVFRTDDNFREATIDWSFTGQRITNTVLPFFEKNNILITQGFIAATDENESTTLGREGSDYTASVFANMLDAKSLTIWKDVEAVKNADPKKYPDAIQIHELNYNEVIEMAYYGAQVIHPKTIKPLQNKNIPLFVKCFLNPALQGTVIHNRPAKNLPPIIVLKENQVLMQMNSKDFSFVSEHQTGTLYQLFEKYKLKPNLTQNTAISFLAVLDNWPEKIEKLAQEASAVFDVQITTNLSLLTIRHFTREVFDKLSEGKKILIQQRTTDTVQSVMQ